MGKHVLATFKLDPCTGAMKETKGKTKWVRKKEKKKHLKSHFLTTFIQEPERVQQMLSYGALISYLKRETVLSAVTITSKSMREREKYKNEKKTNPSRKEQEGQQS